MSTSRFQGAALPSKTADQQDKGNGMSRSPSFYEAKASAAAAK